MKGRLIRAFKLYTNTDRMSKFLKPDEEKSDTVYYYFILNLNLLLGQIHSFI